MNTWRCFELTFAVQRSRTALQKQVRAFATSKLTFWSNITSHNNSFLYSYTRRFLGGRQPLCGIGVTSVMLVILYPQPLSARTADSRPGPGPLTCTSRFFKPYSFAASPARSAATCAAKGVLLREPRKPEPPEVAQLRVLPWRSVIVTMVLLKDA